jgi:hypothetical protein
MTEQRPILIFHDAGEVVIDPQDGSGLMWRLLNPVDAGRAIEDLTRLRDEGIPAWSEAIKSRGGRLTMLTNGSTLFSEPIGHFDDDGLHLDLPRSVVNYLGLGRIAQPDGSAITIGEIAQRFDVTPSCASNWPKGQRDFPKPRNPGRQPAVYDWGEVQAWALVHPGIRSLQPWREQVRAEP